MAEVTTTGLVDQSTYPSDLDDIQWAVAAGTADVLTGAYPVPNTALTDGLILGLRASAANATTTPTFSPDGLAAHVITKNGGQALGVGDIPAALSELLLRYNLAHTRWELLNPARSSASASAAIDKSANYTVLNADNGNTYGLGADAMFTITFNAASGYDSSFRVKLINTDGISGGRGKFIALSGYSGAGIWLYPGQTCEIINDNNSWRVFGLPVRWVAPNCQVYVDYVNGADTGVDGLGVGSSAFKTIQAAHDFIKASVECARQAPTINLAGSQTHQVGTGVTCVYPLVGATELFIQGTTGTIVNCDAGGNCFFSRDLATTTISHMKLTTSGNGSTAVGASQGAVMDVEAGVEYGAFPLGTHIACQTWASVNVFADYAVSGGATQHVGVNTGGYVNYGSFVCTITNTPTITYWATAADLGIINAGGVAITFSGSVANGCQKYSAATNAVIVLSGSTYPGSVAGATATGAQVTA